MTKNVNLIKFLQSIREQFVEVLYLNRCSLGEISRRSGCAVSSLERLATDITRWRIMPLGHMWKMLDCFGYCPQLRIVSKFNEVPEPPYPLQLMMDKIRP